MKKTINVLSILVLLSIIILSCKEDEKSNEPIQNGSATISGIAYINLDARNDTDEVGTPEIQFERVPAGTILRAKINSSDLVQNPVYDYNYGDIYYTTLVGDAGAYSFTIDANKAPVEVEISSNDIRQDYIVNDTVTETHVYNLPTDTFDEYIINHSIKLLDLYFSQK